MVVTSDNELIKLQEIGAICGRTLKVMAEAMEPGMTTAELDLVGRKYLEQHGAQSAPETCYDFPGATCISVNDEVAHGVPGIRKINRGDLVNIDVSAVKNGYYGDTGASFGVGQVNPKLAKLLRDGKRAMWLGIKQVKTGRELSVIGEAIGKFARRNRYTLIENLASHGIGQSLHEYPTEIATWPNEDDKRLMTEGLVFTIEPFLSLGSVFADSNDDDDWTLYSYPSAPTVQFEHSVVVGRNGPIILTMVD